MLPSIVFTKFNCNEVLDPLRMATSFKPGTGAHLLLPCLRTRQVGRMLSRLRMIDRHLKVNGDLEECSCLLRRALLLVEQAQLPRGPGGSQAVGDRLGQLKCLREALVGAITIPR